MKRNLLITSIAVTALGTLLLVNQQKSSDQTLHSMLLGTAEQPLVADSQCLFSTTDVIMEYDNPEAIIEPGQGKDMARALVTPGSTCTLSLDGFSLQAVAGAVTKSKKLSVTGLRVEDVKPMGAGMVNVTDDYKGFRCLPHGMVFEKELEIRIKYDTASIPQGYGPQDIRTFFYDEKVGSWIQLPYDTVDMASCEVVSRTNHFTDFVNAILKTPEAPLTQAFTPTSMKDVKFADPMAGYNVIAPPSANNMGTANMSLPLEIPAGRQGMQPQLAITYNSEGGDGWLGMGWDLSIPCITVDTRWGVPHYYTDLESESYLINGEQLLPMIQRDDFVARNSSGDKVFTPRVEGAFEKIIRHGNTPTSYWWEVIDKNGVKYFYGKYSSDAGTNANCVLSDNSGNIASWQLAETRDLNGNFVRYTYNIETLPVALGAPGHGAKQIFPESIQYTSTDSKAGAYRIDFVLANTLRNDYTVSASAGFPVFTGYLLNKVKISFNDEYIRDYVIKYKTGGFNKKVICFIADITNYDCASAIDLADCSSTLERCPGCKIHRFDYYQDTVKMFSDAVSLPTGSGDSDLKILNDAVTLSSTPSLGKSLTTGWSLGGSLDLGLGSNVCSKSISLGGNYTYSRASTKDYIALMDINSDGLPDRLFKDGDSYKYRKLNMVNGMPFFDTSSTILINGLPGLGKSNNHSNTGGLEAQIGIGSVGVMGSVSWSGTKNYTPKYFADVNADGYPDYINDGLVYYNNLWDHSNPRFEQESNSDIQSLMSDKNTKIFF